jgi:Na+/H+ antiporter NhaD/arsenite permease-like protein
LAVARERHEAQRMHADAVAQIVQSLRTVPLAMGVVLLSLLCFAGGVFTGFAIMEGRQQRHREARLAQALSQLGPFTVPVRETNGVANTSRTSLPRRDVSVLVIE